MSVHMHRICNAIWRRFLSLPVGFVFKYFYNIKFGGEAKFIGLPVFKGKGCISIGNNCVLVSLKLANPIGLYRPCIIEAINEQSSIVIGNNFSASGVCIVSEKSITIGDNVSIGANATIIDTDFHPINVIERNKSGLAFSEEIKIEDDVWIGMNAVILKGVTIHQGAVIGANAVITKSVPAGARAVGNPARIIL